MSTESIEAVIQVGALKVTIKTVLNNNASPQYEKIKIENGENVKERNLYLDQNLPQKIIYLDYIIMNQFLN